MAERKIVKIRCEKNYPEATNHVALGEVLEENPQYIRLLCKIFHFPSKNFSPQAYTTGTVKIRCFPWGRISLMTELPQDLEWRSSEVSINEEGRLLVGNEIAGELGEQE